ncbi:MAG: hypothetical protein QOI13_2526 [Paraburkholderia sp.]|nr:hypothetical protein [Paraburkholderia sp.]
MFPNFAQRTLGIHPAQAFSSEIIFLIQGESPYYVGFGRTLFQFPG